MPVTKEGGERDEDEEEEMVVVVVEQQGNSCDRRIIDFEVHRRVGKSGRNYRTSGTNDEATTQRTTKQRRNDTAE